MRDRVFEDHEEQLIDIHDVKVLFFILKAIIIHLRSSCGHSPSSIYIHLLKLFQILFELTENGRLAPL